MPKRLTFDELMFGQGPQQDAAANISHKKYAPRHAASAKTRLLPAFRACLDEYALPIGFFTGALIAAVIVITLTVLKIN